MLYKVLLVGLIASCLSLYFKEHKNSIGFMILTAASLIIVLITLKIFNGVSDSIKSITEKFSGGRHYMLMLLKILGITYICDLTAGICRDAGNSSIAHQMQMFGKLLVLSLSLPLITSLFELITELI